VIFSGGLPGFPRYWHLAPSCDSASTSGPIGLRARLSSPVSVVSSGSSDAMPAISLMVVPEFFASMTPGARLNLSQWMRIPLELLLNSVPRA